MFQLTSACSIQHASLLTTMDAERRSLVDLPDELLSAIFVVADEQAVLACARVCAAWAPLVASEELWAHHCSRRWPLLQQLGGAPGLRYPPPSWRQLHRNRVVNAPPGTWRTLPSLYDQTLLIASELKPGWITSLGPLLLRVAGLRKLHGLEPWLTEIDNDSHEPAFEELAWLRNLHGALLGRRSLCELLAYAGDRHALEELRVLLEELRADGGGGDGSGELDAELDRGGMMSWLDAWYDSGASEELLQFLSGRSSLEAVRVLLRHCLYSGWVLDERTAEESRTAAAVEACLRLDGSLRLLDAAIKSLHDEGCDMSVTSAQKTAHAAGAPTSHWWWRLEPPCMVSGGCPLIQPLQIS